MLHTCGAFVRSLHTLSVSLHNGRHRPQKAGAQIRVFRAGGLAQAAESHVLWGDGVGSVANRFADRLHPMSQLHQPRPASMVSGGHARAKLHSQVFLRLFHAHHFLDHRMVHHCGISPQRPGRGWLFTIDCGESQKVSGLHSNNVHYSSVPVPYIWWFTLLYYMVGGERDRCGNYGSIG